MLIWLPLPIVMAALAAEAAVRAVAPASASMTLRIEKTPPGATGHERDDKLFVNLLVPTAV
jgi:hypothetical protein